jgi:archaellum component FlaG (FlaF/FlaG flagellin family)
VLVAATGVIALVVFLVIVLVIAPIVGVWTYRSRKRMLP